jgi:hypothetical protein
VVLSALNPKPQPEVLDPLVRELMRDGGKKLPAGKPDLLAELAAALARLQWRELEVWLAIAAAAKGSLRAAALQQQQQQWLGLPGQQQQQLLGDEEQWQQQQQPWDDQQLWQQPPLPQHGWQQQQQGLSLDPAAAVGWQAGSEDYDDGGVDFGEDAEVQGDFWGEVYHEVDQEDEEELYKEDPSYWSLPSTGSIPTGFQQQQQQWIQYGPQASAQPTNSSSSSVWLSLCYPKLAAALAAVGYEEPELMQLLGDAAVRVLPLLSAPELADLASAYAQLGLPHQQLLPALAAQLQQCAHSCSSSSSGGVQGGAAVDSELAAVIRAAHGLAQLGFADVHLAVAVQSAVLSSRSMQRMGQFGGVAAGSAKGLAAAAVGRQQLVELLQLLVLSGCTGSSSSGAANKSKTYPLVRWVCSAVASSGLEALQPLELQAAAAALAELQGYQEAAAAAAVVGAAAVARAEECGPEVLSEVLWGCVTLGCANTVLAGTAVAAVERAAERLQQQQQQKGRKRHAAKLMAAAAAGVAGDSVVQQTAVLGSKHQAQLVWSLQQMCRPDLVQRALTTFGQVYL